MYVENNVVDKKLMRNWFMNTVISIVLCYNGKEIFWTKMWGELSGQSYSYY